MSHHLDQQLWKNSTGPLLWIPARSPACCCQTPPCWLPHILPSPWRMDLPLELKIKKNVNQTFSKTKNKRIKSYGHTVLWLSSVWRRRRAPNHFKKKKVAVNINYERQERKKKKKRKTYIVLLEEKDKGTDNNSKHDSLYIKSHNARLWK